MKSPRLKTTLSGAAVALLARGLARRRARRTPSRLVPGRGRPQRGLARRVVRLRSGLNTRRARRATIARPTSRVCASQRPARPQSVDADAMGAGRRSSRTTYTWHYELRGPPGTKGAFAIGPARMRVDGREMRSNVVNVRVGAGAAASSRARRGSGAAGLRVRAVGGAGAAARLGGRSPTSSASCPTRSRPTSASRSTVTWSLYLTQQPDKYETVTEARTDGFWSEDVPSCAARVADAADDRRAGVPGRRRCNKRALFPLRRAS